MTMHNKPQQHVEDDDDGRMLFMRRKGDRWSLGKEILGTFIGVLPLLIALVVFGASLYADVSVLKANVVIQQARDAMQDVAIKDGQVRIETKLNDLDHYLRDVQQQQQQQQHHGR